MIVAALSLAAALGATLPPGLAEGGDHWRLGTPRGVVHVWRPEGYDARTAGIVVYVHGYYSSADSAWTEDRLAAQFRESGANALFVVPEAPSSGEDPVDWPSVTALLETVRSEVRLGRPAGPLVVVGHSGAWRTIETWLRDRSLAHLILLDALYGNTAPFRAWLRTARIRSGQLIVAAADTFGKSLGFVRGLRGVVRLGSIPESESRLPRSARQARILLLHSQYEHKAMVSDGRVLPVLLRLTSLPARRAGLAQDPGPARPTRASKAGKRGSARRPSIRGSTLR